jgi:hypothetical protein
MLHHHSETPADLRRKELFREADMAFERGSQLIVKAEQMKVGITNFNRCGVNFMCFVLL